MNPNLWASTCQQLLRNHRDPDEITFWLDRLHWSRSEKTPDGKVKVLLSAPNAYLASFIRSSYLNEIQQALSEVVGGSCEVTIDVGQNPNPDENVGFSPQFEVLNPLAPPAVLKTGMVSSSNLSAPTPAFSVGAPKRERAVFEETLDPAQVFRNYIVGPSNQFAYSAAMAAADNPGKDFNPLFIYGPPAVGKTHLMHAIGNHLKKSNPRIRCAIVSAEKFVNEFIESIQHKNPGHFRTKYREAVDVLLIDDIQFIVGKDRSEEEFIHTFNTLHSLKKMIVLTSDKAPREIEGLEERIRTRFEQGMIVDIRPPEIETRIAILRAKAESDDIYLPDEVATFLGTYIKDTVRSLHGALVRLQQHASLTGSEISLDLAKQVLQSSIPEEGQEYTVEMILNAVCKHYSIKLKELKGVSRAKVFSLPRQISMSLIRKYTNLGFREIGVIFGKDHSTVVHACRTIEADIENNPELRRHIEAVREQL